MDTKTLQMILLLLANQGMLVGGQVFLKLGMQRISVFEWTWNCMLHGVLLNAWLLIGVVLLIATNLLWLWMLKIYPFSLIYPLTSLGFVFGMLSGMLVFQEIVNWHQWIGVLLVIGGCLLIAK